MVTRRCVRSFALLALFLGNLSCALAETVACPAILPATRQRAVDGPAGWLSYAQPLKHTLSSVRINLGNPKAGSDGAIYDERTLGTDASQAEIETLNWDLKGLQDAYLVCGYSSTSIVLTRSLARLSRCTVVSVKAKGSARAEIRSAECT
jgi:hypothetical protein